MLNPAPAEIVIYGVLITPMLVAATVGFVAAVVTFPIALQFADEPFLQVEIGLLAAVIVGASTHAALLRYEFGRHRAAGRMSSAV